MSENNELILAHQTLQDFQRTKLAEFNPENEVIHTIVDLIKSRISKLNNEDEFNEELREALRVRMTEASWSEIAQFLIARKNTENTILNSLLAPFTPRDGDRIPLLDTEQVSKSKNDTLLKNTDKDKLQAIEALTQLVTLINSRKNPPIPSPDTNEE